MSKFNNKLSCKLFFLVSYSFLSQASSFESPENFTQGFDSAILAGDVVKFQSLITSNPTKINDPIGTRGEPMLSRAIGAKALNGESSEDYDQIIDILIVNAQTDLDKPDEHGCAPIVYAILAHDIYTLQELLKTGRININAIGEDNKTALDYVKENTSYKQLPAILREESYAIYKLLKDSGAIGRLSPVTIFPSYDEMNAEFKDSHK